MYIDSVWCYITQPNAHCKEMYLNCGDVICAQVLDQEKWVWLDAAGNRHKSVSFQSMVRSACSVYNTYAKMYDLTVVPIRKRAINPSEGLGC